MFTSPHHTMKKSSGTTAVLEKNIFIHDKEWFVGRRTEDT